MSDEIRDRTYLKQMFSAGHMPSQDDFAVLIDSMTNVVDDGIGGTAPGGGEGLEISAGTGGGVLSVYEGEDRSAAKWKVELGEAEKELKIYSETSALPVLSLFENGDMQVQGTASLKGLFIPGVGLINSKATLKAIILEVLKEEASSKTDKPKTDPSPKEKKPKSDASNEGKSGLGLSGAVNADVKLVSKVIEDLIPEKPPKELKDGAKFVLGDLLKKHELAADGSGANLQQKTAQNEPSGKAPLVPIQGVLQSDEPTVITPFNLILPEGSPVLAKAQQNGQLGVGSVSGDGNWHSLAENLVSFQAYSVIAWSDDKVNQAITQAIAVNAGSMTGSGSVTATASSSNRFAAQIQLRWNASRGKLKLQVRASQPMKNEAQIHFQWMRLMPEFK